MLIRRSHPALRGRTLAPAILALAATMLVSSSIGSAASPAPSASAPAASPTSAAGSAASPAPERSPAAVPSPTTDETAIIGAGTNLRLTLVEGKPALFTDGWGFLRRAWPAEYIARAYTDDHDDYLLLAAVADGDPLTSLDPMLRDLDSLPEVVGTQTWLAEVWYQRMPLTAALVPTCGFVVATMDPKATGVAVPMTGLLSDLEATPEVVVVGRTRVGGDLIVLLSADTSDMAAWNAAISRVERILGAGTLVRTRSGVCSATTAP